MNITQVKWNDREPSFEEIKGKLILVTWSKERTPVATRIKTKTLFDEYDWRGVSFSILSEGAVCEWTKVPDNGAGHQETSCNHDFYGGEAGNCEVPHFTYCPFCANPIHIVDELKPLPLLGIEPEIEMVDSYSYSLTWSNLRNHQQIKVIMPTKKMLIDLWNDGQFVKNLTGEK
ncbi:MAG: hypothetical protein WC554_17455 [Clostridia bacterium]